MRKKGCLESDMADCAMYLESEVVKASKNSKAKSHLIGRRHDLTTHPLSLALT